MPELAEVEFYRKQWDCGLGQKVLTIQLHSAKRIFRGTDTRCIEDSIPGTKLLSSDAHGKQMLFHFSGGALLGIHLGMSGKLRVEEPNFIPGKHDHLVLKQKGQSLVFSDPRQFGRVLFAKGDDEPNWWSKLPPRINSDRFTLPLVEEFLQQHRRAPIKAVLLLQGGFPGIGNWMADEILWQSKIHPKVAAGSISEAGIKMLYRKTRSVCMDALKTIGHDFSDPPTSWLFKHRWRKKAHCPRCKTVLNHSAIGGRTTCWCPVCQKD